MQLQKLLRPAILFFMVCTASFTSAQQPGAGRGNWGGAQVPNIGRFYGKVVDENNKGVGYASVQLYAMRFDTVSKRPQPVLVAGQLTQPNGDFSLESLPIMGEFTLKINFLGYAENEQKVKFDMGQARRGNGDNPGGFNAAAVDKDLGNIRLVVSSETLREVTITESAGQVSLALDRKVYRVDQNGVAAGGTAEDALRNVPSLTVDVDGNVIMRNAAPQIFVDGRPSTLSIDQIPADAIDQIEVITNPSAKYDAGGGQSGIVNIVLKKERRIGYSGNVRAGVDMRGRFNTGGDVNARQGKINVFLGGNLNQRRTLSTGETDRLNLFGAPNTRIFQQTATTQDGYFAGGRGGVDWFINNRNTLTLNGNYHGGQWQPDDVQDLRNDFLYSTGTVSTIGQRTSGTERNFRNLGSSLAYKKLFRREGREWTADVNYNASRNRSNGDFQTSYTGGTGSRQRQEGKGTNDFITAQTDFTTPLGTSMKLEAGARLALRYYTSENANYQAELNSENFVRVPGFADRYSFDDRVAAAYGTFSQSFRQWGYQLGLRAESSDYVGRLLDVNTSFRNEYPINFFPSVFVTYKLNEQDNLQLNFARRINRPSFFQLIPFPDFTDSLNLQRGNPALRPEFTNSLEASYQNIFAKGHNLLFTVYYKEATDLITRYQFAEYNPALGRDAIVLSYINSNRSQAYGAEMTLRNTIFKLVELTTNVNAYQSVVDAANVESNLRIEQFSYFVKENLTLRLPKAFTVQFTGEYQSRTAFALDGGGFGRGGGMWGGWGGGPSSTAQGYSRPVWFVDFSLRKDLWKRTASITLSVQDIFRSRRQGSHTESDFFVQDTWRRRDPQLARLNFSYRFGKMDVSLFKRKNTRAGGDGMEGGF